MTAVRRTRSVQYISSMSERRFSEEEVAEILKYAAETDHSDKSLVPVRDGLTLSELQEIGREVGISPMAVQNAAQKFGSITQPTRTILGLPLGVGRTVELNRTLSDKEWEVLVANLRQTFEAPGVVKQEGSLRSWTNGNLQVFLEPTSVGQQLRMRTVKGDAPGLIIGGTIMLTLASAAFLAAVFRGALDDGGFIASLMVMATAGIGMLGGGAFGLPRWARLRQQQMDEIAERVSRATSLPG